jgi:hypothetical protein
MPISFDSLMRFVLVGIFIQAKLNGQRVAANSIKPFVLENT